MQSRHYRPHPYQVLLVTSDGPEMMIMKVCNSVFHVFLHYMVQNYLLGIQSVKNMSSIILCNVGMYRISGSGSGWPDIRPFLAIRFRFRFRQKYWPSPDIAAG